MTPRVGQPAPPFQARSDDGQILDLTALRGRWVVLYFYPKASTPGCSIEAQRFEQALPEFERSGAAVVGVSTDTEASQAKFRDQCQLTFPLLPDGDKAICQAYGVLGGLNGLLGVAARQTFLIDPQGILVHHWKSVNPASHAGEVLRVLHEKQQS
ncbi:peroxiredoxin [Deinococcus cavernae]|uniref:thioredoxin-dependent peroxiredoxin n=1 Tax=Deinococcus cavernae TaxID=2320857 RepID=A0A418VBZ4_9DEIO|nr:peroxiredoxin [Deinococcus cavernae]RJF73637.1 peroxiredoxin [Deinococcus cavernae]